MLRRINLVASIDTQLRVCRMDKAGNIKTRELGVLFQDLRVVGTGVSMSYQPTVGSLFDFRSHLQTIQSIRHPATRDILTEFEGVVRPGEMLREYHSSRPMIRLLLTCRRHSRPWPTRRGMLDSSQGPGQPAVRLSRRPGLCLLRFSVPRGHRQALPRRRPVLSRRGHPLPHPVRRADPQVRRHYSDA